MPKLMFWGVTPLKAWSGFPLNLFVLNIYYKKHKKDTAAIPNAGVLAKNRLKQKFTPTL